MSLSKLFLGAMVVAFMWSCENGQKYYHNTGKVFGTTYSIKYEFSKNVHKDIDNELVKVDNSLSTFNKKSVISLVNKNIITKLDSHFVNVFTKSMKISKSTNGFFDITVAPLVNAWGFGYKVGKKPTKENINVILDYVGYTKISIVNDEVVKQDKRIILDCSAIAKGYGIDVVSEYLDRLGIKNYLVEIGGEVRAKGVNYEKKIWKIGISKPVFDPLGINSEIIKIIELNNKSVATSGNYRNYYVRDSVIYAHTINPINGHQTVSNLLSVSVISNECMRSDALATAYMAMGYDKAVDNIKGQKGISVYLIYRDLESKEIICKFFN